jgi:hypothetical protein
LHTQDELPLLLSEKNSALVPTLIVCDLHSFAGLDCALHLQSQLDTPTLLASLFLAFFFKLVQHA